MRISCPFCDFSKEIDAARVPPGARRATCPKCHQKFDIGLDPEVPAAPAAPPEPPPIPGEIPSEPRSTTMDSDRPVFGTRAPDSPTTRPPVGTGPVPPPLPPSFPPGGSPDPVYPAFKPSAAGDQAYQSRYPERAAPEETFVPWEERSGGLLADLWETTKMVLFHPAEFFDAPPRSYEKKAPLTYAVIVGSVGWIFAAFWQVIFAVVGVSMTGEDLGIPTSMLGVGLAAMLVMAPLLVALGLYLGAAIIHLLLMMVRGAEGGYAMTFRVMAYSMATGIWQVVPILGGLAAGIWSLIVMIIGLPRVHRTTPGRVVVAVLVIPIVLTVVLMVVLGILAAVLIPMFVKR